MGGLKDYARRNSKYAIFDEKGILEGIFGGWKTIPKDVFGEEREVARYTMDGKTFDSTSGSLATQMDSVLIGKRIRIERKGQGADTKYNVEILD